MADETMLVVREWVFDNAPYSITEHNALARAYRAVVEERDEARALAEAISKQREEFHWARREAEDKLTASEAHSENLAKSTIKAKEELAAAILVIKEIDGRAQVSLESEDWAMEPWLPLKALRDIRAYCERALDHG